MTIAIASSDCTGLTINDMCLILDRSVSAGNLTTHSRCDIASLSRPSKLTICVAGMLHFHVLLEGEDSLIAELVSRGVRKIAEADAVCFQVRIDLFPFTFSPMLQSASVQF